MRVSCPNCASCYELPNEYLGRKGRTLVCANCPHSWFQTIVSNELYLSELLSDSTKNVDAREADQQENTSAPPFPEEAFPEEAAFVAGSESGSDHEPEQVIVANIDSPDLEVDMRDVNGGPTEAVEGLDEAGSGDEEENSGRQRAYTYYLNTAVLFALVLALAVLFWFGRDKVSDMSPAMDRLYDRLDGILGLDVGGKDAGLQFNPATPRSSLISVDGVRTLVVSGFIVNGTGVLKTVPGLRLELLDETGEVVQELSALSPIAVVDPKESIPYEIRLKQPITAARKFRVVWDQ